jgi:hypothetical protein
MFRRDFRVRGSSREWTQPTLGPVVRPRGGGTARSWVDEDHVSLEKEQPLLNVHGS